MFVQRSRISLIAALCAISLSVPAASNTEAPDDILVLVNRNAEVSNMSKDELVQIFLKKKTTWSGGKRIITINASDRSPLRQKFREKVLRMDADAEATFWENQKLRHQIDPPIEMSNTTKAVYKLKSSISYAFRKDVPQNLVKVVLVID